MYHLVYGYVRSVQQIFPKNILYYNIPISINYICGLYFFQLTSATYIIDDTTKIITQTKWNSGCSLLSNIVSKGKHEWKFKLIKYENEHCNICTVMLLVLSASHIVRFLYCPVKFDISQIMVFASSIVRFLYCPLLTLSTSHIVNLSCYPLHFHSVTDVHHSSMSNPQKRKRNTTFLNKTKPPSPPHKKKKIIKNRCDLSKKDKYDFIQCMHDNPELSVEDCMGKDKWKRKLKQTKLNTAQRWKKEYPQNSTKLEN